MAAVLTRDLCVACSGQLWLARFSARSDAKKKQRQRAAGAILNPLGPPCLPAAATAIAARRCTCFYCIILLHENLPEAPANEKAQRSSENTETWI